MTVVRLTDEDVVHLIACFEHDANMGHDCVLVHPQTLLDAFTELRERRASDLTEEERAAVMWARRDLSSMHTPYKTSDHDMYLRAIAALGRILGGKP